MARREGRRRRRPRADRRGQEWRAHPHSLLPGRYLGEIKLVERRPYLATLPLTGSLLEDTQCPLAGQVRRSVRSVRGNQWMFRCGHPADQPLRVRPELLKAARDAGLKTMIGCMIETSVLISAAAHLAELTDYLDIDGNLLTTNDPYLGVTAENGLLSFAQAPVKTGLRVSAR